MNIKRWRMFVTTEHSPFSILYPRNACFFMKKYIPFLLLILLASCQESFYFSESKTFDQGAWVYQDSVDFEVTIPDTTTFFDLVLDLEHTTSYPYQNIYLYIHTLFPTGERYGKQVNIDLADKTGQWQGDCSGEVCNVRVDLQRSAYFNKMGVYTFTVKQFMRMDTLQSIQSVALRLREKQIPAEE